MNAGKPQKTSLHSIYCHPVIYWNNNLSVLPVLFPEPVPTLVFQFRSVLSGKVRRMHTQMPGIHPGRRWNYQGTMKGNLILIKKEMCPFTNRMFEGAKINLFINFSEIKIVYAWIEKRYTILISKSIKIYDSKNEIDWKECLLCCKSKQMKRNDYLNLNEEEKVEMNQI